MVISPVIIVSMKWREVAGGHWVVVGGHRRNNAHRNVAIRHPVYHRLGNKRRRSQGLGRERST